MHIDTIYKANQVESRYKGITATKFIGLKNFFGDSTSMTVHQVEFVPMGSFGKTYKTNILVMEEGKNFLNFDEVIAAKVYSFLEDLNLIDSTYQNLSEENPSAFKALYEKCKAFVFETFDAGTTDAQQIDYTFNNFFELLIDMCLISAYTMINTNEESDFYAHKESKRRFSLITNQTQSWGSLFNDVGKAVNIAVKPEKVVHSIFYVNTYYKMRTALQKITGVFN